MRALFVVQPLVMHNRPFHYWAWLGYCVELAEALRQSGWAIRIATNEMLAARATAPKDPRQDLAQRGHGLPAAEVIALGQEPIRRLFQAPNVAIVAALHHRTGSRAQLDGYAAMLRAAVGDFAPDVVLTLSPAEPLRLAFPDALVLSSETAAYSRGPFPMTYFLDPLGLWDHSAPMRLAAELMERPSPPAEAALLAEFRARFARYLQAVSPFGPLVAELRQRVRRVGLLPLQFGGEPGFDANGPFRNQGELLFHVLEHLPDDVGLLVTEHPTAHWVGDLIDDETRAYVSGRYPRVRFVDFRLASQAGQLLLQHADFVISVSSSLAWQALLFGKPLVALGGDYFAPYATLRALEPFPDELPAPARRIDNALGWVLSHYFAPVPLMTTPGWLAARLQHFRDARRAGLSGLALFMPLGDAEQIRAALFQQLDAPAAPPALAGRVRNGDFAAWSRGDGPFGPGSEGPDGWELLAFHGGQPQVARVAPDGDVATAARVWQSRASAGHSLFLQRVPGVAAYAGRPVRLRFRARSQDASPLASYLYMQLDDGKPGLGVPARAFALDGRWRDYELVATLPPLDGRAPGRLNHVEIVFALQPEPAVQSFELTAVQLERLLMFS
jgi:hypothetical protein